MKNHVSRRSHLKIIPVPNDKCTVSYMSINSNSDSNSNDNVDVNVNVVNYTMHTVATTTLRTAFYGTWRAAIRSKTFFCTDLVSAAMPRRDRGGAVCMWFPERRGRDRKGETKAPYLHIALFLLPLRAACVYCRTIVLLRHFRIGPHRDIGMD